MYKIFYGWWIVLAMFMITMVTSIGVSTLSLFYPYLMTEFKWTQEQMTRAPSVLYLASAISAPVVGILLDKSSPRLLITLGSLSSLLALFLYTQVQNLNQLMLVYVLYAISLAFSSAIPGMFLLTRWFNRYRGLATGIFLVGSSFGAIVFSQVVKVLLQYLDWREAAFYLLGIATLVVLPPLFIIRNHPQVLGLEPDGISEPKSSNSDSESLTSQKLLNLDNQSISLYQALQSWSFYLIFLATALAYFDLTGVYQNLSIYYQDLKVGSDLKANLNSLYFTASILGKVLFGYLSDKFPKKYIFMLATLNMALGLVLLQLAAQNPALFLLPFAIGFGFGYSGVYTMVQLLIAEYYQGKSYGSILGFISVADLLAGSFGIWYLGYLRTEMGNYYWAFNLCIFLCLLALLAVAGLPIYKQIPNEKA
jgi:MFS family permease